MPTPTKSKLDTLNLSGWPVADEYLIEIGRIALLWNKLEMFMASSVAYLTELNNPDTPAIDFIFSHAQQTFEQDLEILKALCPQLISIAPSINNYQDVVTQLNNALKLKKHFVNGSISENPGTGGVEIDVPNEDNTSITSQTVSLVDLKQVMLKIDEAQHGLYKMIASLERPDRRDINLSN